MNLLPFPPLNSNLMATVICYDVDGNTVSVSPGALLFRPAVYGIFIENNQILLVRDAASNLWQPPGAPLAENEKIGRAHV